MENQQASEIINRGAFLRGLGLSSTALMTFYCVRTLSSCSKNSDPQPAILTTPSTAQQAFNNFIILAVRQSRALVYIQHNPTITDGAQGLIQLILFLKPSGLKIVRTSYQRLAVGDCMISLSGAQNTFGTQLPTDAIIFDLTRLDDAGKDTEHWDVIEPVSSANKSKGF